MKLDEVDWKDFRIEFGGFLIHDFKSRNDLGNPNEDIDAQLRRVLKKEGLCREVVALCDPERSYPFQQYSISRVVKENTKRGSIEFVKYLQKNPLILQFTANLVE